MPFRLKLLPATLLLAVSTAFAAHADEIKVQHTKGEVSLEKTPSRIVAFDLASLDTLSALGVDVAGVPAGNKPDYLSKYESADVAKVGSLFEPDYEAVAELKPDLIIVAGRSSAKFADLQKIAPTIDLTTRADNFLADAQNNVRTLGKIFGKQTEADALLSKLAASTSDLKARAGDKGKALLVLTTGGKMSSFGPGSRFGMLFSDYGFTAAEAEGTKGTHGRPASFEYISETNPEWLFIIDRDAAIGREGAAKKMLDNELVNQTKAAKDGHVVYLNSVSWYLIGGGITAMQATVDQLLQSVGTI